MRRESGREVDDILVVGQGRVAWMYDKRIEKMGCVDPGGKLQNTRVEGCDGLQRVWSSGRYGEDD